MKRQNRITTEAMSAALEASGGSVSEAAAALGCHPSTIYKRSYKDESLAKWVEDYDHEVRALASDGLRIILENPDHPRFWDAVKFVKERRELSYHPRQELDVTSKGESVNRTWIIVDPPEPDDNE